ncbi:hypothetical protein D3C87_1874450 [compost metagenome]
MVRSISWAVVSRVMPRPTSERSSVTSGPTMWAPSTSPYLASTTTLTKPSASPSACALPLGAKGNLPIFTSKPRFLASASVRPIEATWGSE